ncbi:hypothetical protein QCA50_005799 [Cerrena zonata]|uniref:glucan 1,3-beta-glucosidase n=1 Tax=Cerrena zonata TaxID=2478898 RepID=A0AAW0GNE6_9APHY
MMLIIFPILLSFLGRIQLSHAQQCRLLVGNNNSGTGTPGGALGSPTPTSGSTGTSSSASTAAATPTLAPFNYGKDTIRGVNLGGWFVLEPWITPSLFQNTNDTSIVDEFTLGQKLDNDTALDILQNHWETWITEDDFKAIKAAGLNHVRIPLGYWSVPMTSADTNFTTSVAPFTPGAWPYFVQALNWAKQNGLHTIVDLHGAPGSQNGFDNSGQLTSNPTWGTDQTSVSRTLDIVRVITKKVGG